MIRTQIYMPEDLHYELKLLAKASGVNYSHLIREGARDVVKKRLKKKSKGLEKLIGFIKADVKTDAVKDFHDYYLHDAV